MTDHDDAIEVLAARKLADRELKTGPVGNPSQWLRAVREGIKIDHAGRLATIPDGLSLNDQVRWIDNGPPTPGARIPPTDLQPVLDLLPPEAWTQGITAARAALRKDHDAADL